MRSIPLRNVRGGCAAGCNEIAAGDQCSSIHEQRPYIGPIGSFYAIAECLPGCAVPLHNVMDIQAICSQERAADDQTAVVIGQGVYRANQTGADGLPSQ